MPSALGPFRRIRTRIPGTNPTRWRAEWQSLHPKSVAARAVDSALLDVGYTEEPEHHKNDNKYGRRWGENYVPWCGLFVADKWDGAGFDIPRSLALAIDYVPELISLARRRKHGLFIVGKNRVRRGDAVALEFTGDEVADHVELFVRWIDKKAGTFMTVGGNTSRAGSQANGGAVCVRVRAVDQVQAFVRMGRVKP